MAELIQAVFQSDAIPKARLEAARELQHLLKTTWRQVSQSANEGTNLDLFPMTILSSTKRGYLVKLGRQMNGCYVDGWYDACAVMMRRLFEIAILEAFEANNIQDQIKGHDGNYLQLTDLVSRTLNCKTWTLSRNSQQALPKIKDLGHLSAHGKFFTSQKNDIDKIASDFRVVMEELLHHAKLIN